MTRDDITRMAREAGYGDAMADLHGPALERFFHMAQAAALEHMGNASMKAAERAVDTAIALEREACARLCLETEPFYGVMFADAIRARGQA